MLSRVQTFCMIAQRLSCAQFGACTFQGPSNTSICILMEEEGVRVLARIQT